MPAPILHLGATVLCAHAGQATPIVAVSAGDRLGPAGCDATTPYAVAGCGLTGTSTPPCVTAQWTVGATRVVAGGVPVATMAGTSVCVPTGTPLMPVVAQTRVLAT